MVKVRVSVRVVIRVRLLSASTLNDPQICSPHFTSGQWLYGMMLAVRTYRRIHTCYTTLLTKSAASTDGSSSLHSFVNV